MKAMFTTSIDFKTLEKFKEICLKRALKYSAVIEELIEKYIRTKE